MDNSKKSNISKKKKEQLSKNILETLKKKKECEKKALDIVIELIDGGLEEADLLNKLHSINPSYYEDVVEERFILKQCGYVMCKKKLEYIPNQKYKISLALKKVYDISERKKFCSNICFKSSKYLQNQLLTTPLWLREKDAVPTFKLLNIHTEEDIASHLHTKPDGHTKSSTPLITIPTPSDTKRTQLGSDQNVSELMHPLPIPHTDNPFDHGS